MRLASAACYAVDVRLSRLIHQWREGQAAYELRGQCTHCGACCVTPTVALPVLLYRLASVRRLILAWHRHVNLFELIEEDRAGESREARLARDADQISLILELKELDEIGYRPPQDWLPHVLNRLQTETGKALAEAVMATRRDAWWWDTAASHEASR